MSDSPLAALRWPAPYDKAQGLQIVAIDTPHTPIRDTARQLVRSALREIMGDVELISVPGRAIRLARSDSPIGISISHENGLSLLAVNFSGPVGIDLLRIPDDPDWEAQIPMLASDYLGPTLARQLNGLAPPDRLAHFARAWAGHEARLKCLGLALTEWSSGLDASLAGIQARPLALPAGYIGAVATKAAGNRAS
jgi:4'-phosphopantetheinyl transferase